MKFMLCRCGTELDAMALGCPNCGEMVDGIDSEENNGVEFTPGAVVLDKYEIMRMLGRGGMGQVYLARDRQLERLIALKTLSKDFNSDEEYKARFIREARMASALNHPNILTVYEVGSIDNTLFIATEYVEGQTLRQIMDSHPLKMNESLDVAIQVAQGLSAAHEVGIIHRDLKLENFIQRKDGYVKILDFGLAKSADVFGGSSMSDTGGFKTRAGLILGTPNYMSPEQAKGLQLDARSDIFSFGTVLYELITNVIAFEADNDMQVLFKVAFHEPQQIPDTVPERLTGIIKRAMQKSPELRYQKMREMLDDLITARDELRAGGQLVGGNSSLTTTQSIRKEGSTGQHKVPITGSTDRLTASREKFSSVQSGAVLNPDYDQFVGRNSEMETLKMEYQRIREGKGRPVLILGDSGSGKTQMLTRFQQWVQGEGASAAISNFFDYGGSLTQPYQAFLSLLISTLGLRDTKAISPSSSGAVSEGEGWKRVASQVKMRFGLELSSGLIDRNFASNDEAEKWRIFESLNQVFLRIAQEKPLALLFDNLHWADGLSLEFIGYMLRNLGGAPIAIVATAGEEESNKAGEPLREWLLAQSRYSNFERIRLKPFGTQEVRQALDAIFHRIEISEREITHLCEVTSGNPYYLTELIRLLVSDKKIALGEGWWHCYSLQGMELPTTIGIAVQYKLEHCNKEIYELLSQAAVIGDSFRFDVLAILADKDEDELEKMLATAVKAFLIREERGSHGDEYRFYNTIIRQVLYDALGKRQKRRLHASAAAAIQEVYRNKLGRVYSTLAYHFNAANEWGQAFDFSVKALEQAWERDNWGEVAKHAQWAEEAAAGIEENPDDYDPLDQAVIAQAKIKYSTAMLRMGKIDQAVTPAQTALEIAERLKNNSIMARTKDLLCEIHRFQGRFQAALKLADEGLEAAKAAGDNAAERLIHYHRGWVGWRVEPFDKALEHLSLACRMSEESSDMKVLVQARLYYGIVLHCQGDWREGSAVAMKGCELTQKLGDRYGETIAHTMLVLVSYYERRHERLREFYEAGIQIARTVGWRVGEAYFHILIGFDYLLPTNLDLSLAWDYLQRGVTICQETGEKGLLLLAGRGLAKIDTLTGQHPQAISKLQEILGVYKKFGEMFDQGAAYCFLGEAQEAAGNTEAALESFVACYEIAGKMPFPIWQWQALYGEARCLHRLGKTKQAVSKLSAACAVILKLRHEFESEESAANFIEETQVVYDALEEWSKQ
jgi:serine/threonine protein kinase/tetratricopeptide (TPR) repeat protein